MGGRGGCQRGASGARPRLAPPDPVPSPRREEEVQVLVQQGLVAGFPRRTSELCVVRRISIILPL